MMIRWIRRTAILGGLLLFAQLIARLYLRIWPKITPPGVAFLLDSRMRQRYRDPLHTLAPLRLQNGQIVLEIGAGTGAFTIAAAEQIAPDGRLIGIELQRGMLRRLIQRVRAAHTPNICLQQASALALPLRNSSVDAVYMIAVLPMVPNKQQVLCEVRRVLKPNGVLAVSEEVLAPEYVLPRTTIRWCERAGFTVTQRSQDRWCYMIIFQKAVNSTAP